MDKLDGDLAHRGLWRDISQVESALQDSRMMEVEHQQGNQGQHEHYPSFDDIQ